jgi:hypothetical protein
VPAAGPVGTPAPETRRAAFAAGSMRSALATHASTGFSSLPIGHQCCAHRRRLQRLRPSWKGVTPPFSPKPASRTGGVRERCGRSVGSGAKAAGGDSHVHVHAHIRGAICGSSTVMRDVAPSSGRMESSRTFSGFPELQHILVHCAWVPPDSLHASPHPYLARYASFSILPLIAPWNSSSATMFVAGGRHSPEGGA